jgi:hypothetical protein
MKKQNFEKTLKVLNDLGILTRKGEAYNIADKFIRAYEKAIPIAAHEFKEKVTKEDVYIRALWRCGFFRVSRTVPEITDACNIIGTWQKEGKDEKEATP